MTTNLLGYVDPQVGSFFFQILIGGLIGGAVMLRQGWQSLKARLFSRASNGPIDSL